MKNMLNRFDKLMLYSGVSLILSGIIYPPLSLVGAAILFLWWLFLVVVLSPLAIKDIVKDSIEKHKMVKFEAKRRQRVRETQKPKALPVTLGSFHEQGMDSDALVLIEDGSENLHFLNQDDYLRVYNQDSTILFEGFIELAPTLPWYKALFARSTKDRTQRQCKNWESWFYQDPALRAELTRYLYEG